MKTETHYIQWNFHSLFKTQRERGAFNRDEAVVVGSRCDMTLLLVRKTSHLKSCASQRLAFLKVFFLELTWKVSVSPQWRTKAWHFLSSEQNSIFQPTLTLIPFSQLSATFPVWLKWMFRRWELPYWVHNCLYLNHFLVSNRKNKTILLKHWLVSIKLFQSCFNRFFFPPVATNRDFWLKENCKFQKATDTVRKLQDSLEDVQSLVKKTG